MGGDVDSTSMWVERVSRRLDEIGRDMARREDVQNLAARVDVLGATQAGHSVRLEVLDRAMAATVGVDLVDALGVRLGELSVRVDEGASATSGRLLGLSGQVSGWAVSLVLLVGASLFGFLLGHHP